MQEKERIGYEIHTLDRMINQFVGSLFEEENLTKMQSWIIRFLYDHREENIFQKDIEAYFRIARSTATGILQGMEKQGLLTREPVPADARLKRVVLTEKGICIHLAVIHKFEAIERTLRKNIPQEKLDIFFETIRQMGHNMTDTGVCACCHGLSAGKSPDRTSNT